MTGHPTRNASPLDFNGLWLLAMRRAEEHVERMYPPLHFETEKRAALERLALRYYQEFTRPT